MDAIDFCIFLTCYSVVVAVAIVGQLIWSGRWSLLLSLLAALAVIASTTVVGYYLRPGTNYLGLLWFLVQERDTSAAVSAALGVAAAVVWLILPVGGSTNDDQQVGRGWIWRILSPLVLAASILGVAVCCQAFIWKEMRGIKLDPIVRVHAPEFVIEKVADLNFLPIRVAASETGKVYVCYTYHEIWGTMGGAIVELIRDEDSGQFHNKIVADSPLLLRSYGLQAKDGQLFVSRTGIHSQANDGEITYQNTGAVTQLKDLDGDGYFEFNHDIVSDLPGCRGPETIHQNNGIAFAADGSLYVTSAAAADRSLDNQPWEGTILRVSPDLSRTEVFARGFRNPFGLVVGPDNELFVADNDVDESPGDELNHVIQGGHYGHPYVVPNEPLIQTAGFHEPILVGGHESNYLGMVYTTSPELPEAFRDCIYMCDLMQNAIMRLKLEKSGDTYKVAAIDRFATISTPVDIAVTPAGEFFIASRRTQNVYRIRPRRTANKE